MSDTPIRYRASEAARDGAYRCEDPFSIRARILRRIKTSGPVTVEDIARILSDGSMSPEHLASWAKGVARLGVQRGYLEVAMPGEVEKPEKKMLAASALELLTKHMETHDWFTPECVMRVTHCNQSAAYSRISYWKSRGYIVQVVKTVYTFPGRVVELATLPAAKLSISAVVRQHIAEHGTITQAQAEEITGLHPDEIRKVFRWLRKSNLIGRLDDETYCAPKPRVPLRTNESVRTTILRLLTTQDRVTVLDVQRARAGLTLATEHGINNRMNELVLEGLAGRVSRDVVCRPAAEAAE